MAYWGCCAGRGNQELTQGFGPLVPRGKCSVTLLNETDILSQYLEKEVRKRCGEKEGGGDAPEGKRRVRLE